ncbi:MAG: HAD family hydrolase [Candidatus Promineifilaceae bacterium]
MITTLIFDLDGTLVQTEKLKARSYAKAAVELCPISITEDEVIAAFKEVVGLPRREVATRLVEQFNLTEKASAQMAAFNVSKPWQAFVQVRLKHYHKMLDDRDLIWAHQWAHNIELLQLARANCKHVALATMSRCEQASRVLDILHLQDAFDFVATRDDVEFGKPNPEIYHLVAGELGVSVEECLVIEDSPSGVQAALNAGMQVMAVATPFTRDHLQHLEGLSAENLVLNPADVLPTAARIIQTSQTNQ